MTFHLRVSLLATSSSRIRFHDFHSGQTPISSIPGWEWIRLSGKSRLDTGEPNDRDLRFYRSGSRNERKLRWSLKDQPKIKSDTGTRTGGMLRNQPGLWSILAGRSDGRAFGRLPDLPSLNRHSVQTCRAVRRSVSCQPAAAAVAADSTRRR